MSRSVMALLVLLVVVVGGLFLLASRARERTPVRVEKAVDLAKLQG